MRLFKSVPVTIRFSMLICARWCIRNKLTQASAWIYHCPVLSVLCYAQFCISSRLVGKANEGFQQKNKAIVSPLEPAGGQEQWQYPVIHCHASPVCSFIFKLSNLILSRESKAVSIQKLHTMPRNKENDTQKQTTSPRAMS